MLGGAEERRELVERIARSFRGVRRENGISLREAEEIDNRSGDRERADARALDNEESWEQVDGALIERYSSAWGFLDAVGFRYYLPAVMIWSIEHGDSTDSSTPDNLLWLLGDPERQRWCEKFLSPQQRECVASFVAFMLRTYWRYGSDDDSTRSLRRYWQGS